MPGVLLPHVQSHIGSTEGVRQGDVQTLELDGVGGGLLENWRPGEPVAEGLHFLGRGHSGFPGRTCTENIL